MTTDLGDLWIAALHEYKSKTKINLSTDDILGSCDFSDPDDIAKQLLAFVTVKTEQERALWRRVLKPVVDVALIWIETVADVAASVGAPGGKAILVGTAVLLKATRDATASSDLLHGLFEDFSGFFNRLPRILKANQVRAERQKIYIQFLEQYLVALATARTLVRPGMGPRIKRFVDRLRQDNKLAEVKRRMSDLVRREQSSLITDIFTISTEILPSLTRIESSVRNIDLRSRERSRVTGSMPSDIETTLVPALRGAKDIAFALCTTTGENQAKLWFFFQLCIFIATLPNYALATRGSLLNALCFLAFPMLSTLPIFDSITLVDLRGLPIHLPMDRCITWAKLTTSILDHYQLPRNAGDRSFVAVGRYTLQSGSDSTVVTSTFWKPQPGMQVAMAMVIFRRKPGFSFSAVCPGCATRMEDRVDGNVFKQCEHCFQCFLVTRTSTPNYQAANPKDVRLYQRIHIEESTEYVIRVSRLFSSAVFVIPLTSVGVLSGCESSALFCCF
ncbi:hypothetical protein DL96DRAFT_371715 [Flagelloscypha sp. PMI_526]|nr:hypothetical protein DL96DRAFT_371715 [Flagelloscypha sp. PMI_526]